MRHIVVLNCELQNYQNLAGQSISICLTKSVPTTSAKRIAQTLRRQNRHEFNDIIVATKEADVVIERLCDAIDKYGVILADLYDLLGLQTSYIDQN
jgi:hypothetical protein